MAYRQCEYDEALVLDLADHAEVADPVAPQARQISAERLSEMSGILAILDPVIEPIKDTLGDRPVDFLNLLLGE